MGPSVDHFGHWIENARASQVGATAFAVLAAVALLLASIVMAPGDHETVAAGPAPVLTPSIAPTPTMSVSSPSVSGQSGQSGQPGQPGQPGLASSPVSAAGGQSATNGGKSGAPQGAVPGDPATASPAITTAPPAPSPAPAAELVASDRGITESTVTIGIIHASDSLNSAGFSTFQRDDRAEYLQGLQDYVNARGGVVGRQLVLTARPTDATSTSDQDAACQSMLNDRRVFGVLDAALSNGPAQSCIASQGQTPYAHLTVWSSDFQAASGGYDVGFQPAIDRIARGLARELPELGWLSADSTVGVFGDSCPTTEPTVRDVLVPLLEATGAAVEVGLHDCTIDGAVSQPGNIATRFRTARVDRVLLVANYVSTQVFLDAANSLGGWQPEYAVSDWFAGVSDSLSTNYNKNQFDGALALTTMRDALVNAGRSPHEGFARCNEVAVEAGLEPLDGGGVGELLVFCDLLFLMLDGLEAAGPNPTRPMWAAAIPTLSQRQSSVWGPSSFSQGKSSGADRWLTARWSADCTCYEAVSDLRPIHG